MKRIFIILFALLPMLLNAGVIMKRSGERLDEISIKSVSDTDIVYVDASGNETTILKNDVSAILYDDGRYEEIKQSAPLSQNVSDATTPAASFGDDVTEFNVLAFGNYIMKFYKIDHEYDGTLVEYRIIYKGQKEEPEWKYFGTTPFAYTTSTGSNSLYLKGEASQFVDVRPFGIENYQNVKKVQFRLSKEGYQTVVVSPLIQVNFTGFFFFISLNKLKPLKGGKSENVSSTVSEDIPLSEVTTTEQAIVTSAVTEPIIEEPIIAEPIVEVPPVDPYLQYQDGLIHRLNSYSWYYIDSIYSKKDIKSIILSCPDAKAQYQKGKKWVIGGWSTVGASIALVITGGILVGVGDAIYWQGGYSYSYGNINQSAVALDIAGISIMAASSGIFVAGLTVACIGHSRMNNAYKVYNTKCATKTEPAISFNFGTISSNGIGIRMNF